MMLSLYAVYAKNTNKQTALAGISPTFYWNLFLSTAEFKFLPMYNEQEHLGP
jgi:hypothetical protein